MCISSVVITKKTSKHFASGWFIPLVYVEITSTKQASLTLPGAGGTLGTRVPWPL